VNIVPSVVMLGGCIEVPREKRHNNATMAGIVLFNNVNMKSVCYLSDRCEW
jgi:hypothetical protein